MAHIASFIACFRPRNLYDEWTRHGAGRRALRIAIMLSMLLLVASPVTFSLVTYVDDVGVDLLLLLLEAQIAFGAAWVVHKLWHPLLRRRA